MTYGGLTFPSTGCIVRDVGNIYLLIMIYLFSLMAYCFRIYPPPKDVFVERLY